MRDIVELHCDGGVLHAHHNMLVTELDALQKLVKEGMVELGEVTHVHTGVDSVLVQEVRSTKTARTTVKIWHSREARELAEEEAGAAA